MRTNTNTNTNTNNQKYNSRGEALCRLCGHAGENLETHVESEHGMSPVAYATEFPGWPLQGHGLGGSGLAYKARPTKPFSVKECFGFYWDPDTKTDKQVQGYQAPGPYTPPIDPAFVFPPEETQMLLMALHKKKMTMLTGPTGCGKTAILAQICARLNYNYVRINFDGNLTRSDLVGQFIVNGRSMEFCYGVLPRAMALPGTLICLDEYDAVGEDLTFVLQRVLEQPSQLTIFEKGEEMVALHPDNAIFATANTAGMGDDSGLYSTGTNILNYSQINRWSYCVRMDYLDAKKEAKILMNRFDGDLEDFEAEFIIQAINAVREGFLNGEFSVPLSTRDAINFADTYLDLSADFEKAARYCFVNRAPVEEQDALMDVVQRVFNV